MSTITGDVTVPVLTTGSDRFFSYVPIARRPSSEIALRYSGGANNVAATNSIGGPVSSSAAKYPGSQSYTASAIPGITITHASKNPEGSSGYLLYTASSKTVTWTNHNGVVSSVALLADGWYAVGTTTTGYLRLYVTFLSLPTANVGQPVVIQNLLGTLFDTPASNEFSQGSTEYRALYLVNESSNQMTDILLTLLTDTPASTVYIASSYSPLSTYFTPRAEGLSFAVFNHRTYTPPVSTGLNAQTLRERLINTTPNGYPHFVYYPTDASQNSDGVSIDLEVQLQDRYDSTNKLATLEWGSSLQWSSIAPGRMVSFWVKRIVPPDPPIPLIETIDFDVTFTLL